MQPILVAYGTTEGHTREVAEFIAERLRIRSHRVDVVDTASAAAAQVQPIYQAAFLGGSVHYHKHQTALAHFIRANLAWLAAMPTAFFSVNLAMKHIDAGDQIEAERNARAFLEETGLQPRRFRLVAGALKYSEYDFFRRFMQRAMAGTGAAPPTPQPTMSTPIGTMSRPLSTSFSPRPRSPGRAAPPEATAYPCRSRWATLMAYCSCCLRAARSPQSLPEVQAR